MDEFQRGYRLHDRILRPAMVTVSTGLHPTKGITHRDQGACGLFKKVVGKTAASEADFFNSLLGGRSIQPWVK